MIKADLEALLPEIQSRYDELNSEKLRIEGEFRRVQQLIESWKDKTEPIEGEVVTGEEKEQAVDAQTQPEGS